MQVRCHFHRPGWMVFTAVDGPSFYGGFTVFQVCFDEHPGKLTQVRFVMNTNYLSVLLTLSTLLRFGLTSSQAAGGDDPFRKVPRTAPPIIAPSKEPVVKLVLETYELDPMVAREILIGDGPLSAYDCVVELAAKGRAKLDKTSALMTPSGSHARIEEQQEYQYAVEWDPAELFRPNEGGKKPADDAATTTGPDGLHWTEAPRATAFETRNLGVMVDIDPLLRDGACDVVLAIETVSHPADREMAPGTKIVKPIFEKRRVSLSTAIPLGTPTFLTTLSSPRETGVPGTAMRPPVTLCFLTAVSEGMGSSKQRAPDATAGSYVAVLEAYSMPQPLALEVLKLDQGAMIERTLASVAEGRARLEELLSFRGLAEQSQRLESQHEFVYATEWDNPQLTTDETKRWPQIPPIFSLPVPTTMETRDVGITFELLAKANSESAWNNRLWLSANHLGEVKEEAPGSHIYVPVFQTRASSSEIAVPMRAPSINPTQLRGTTFVGTIKAPEGTDRTWLIFLTMYGRPATADVLDRANKIVLPSFTVREAKIDQVLKQIETLSREADPSHKGVEIELRSTTQSSTPVTISLANTPVIEVIKYVTALASLRFTSRNGIIVVSEATPGLEPIGLAKPIEEPSLIESVIKMPRRFFGKSVPANRDLCMYLLAQRGIPFPSGAWAEYRQEDESLLVKVTPEAMEVIRAFAKAAEAGEFEYLTIEAPPAHLRSAVALTQAGIRFPENSAAFYLPSVNRLVVIHTKENIELISRLLNASKGPAR